jgi:hypothetical protein
MGGARCEQSRSRNSGVKSIGHTPRNSNNLQHTIYLFLKYRAPLIQVQQSELNLANIEFAPFLFTVLFTVVKLQIRMETTQNCLVFFFHFD